MKTKKVMMNKYKEPFLFVDGWNIYCSNGNFTRITKKDLKDAKKKGMKIEEIKSMAFLYLTQPKDVEEIVTEYLSNKM